MPLITGAAACTKAGFRSNVKKEIESGKSQDQALAIAYAACRNYRESHKAGKTEVKPRKGEK